MRDETLEKYLLEEAKIVFKYLKKMGASTEDAEDIIQETLYKTIKNIDAINEDKVRAWLFKVAINSYYNLYNKNKRQSNFDISDLENLKMITESTEDSFLIGEKTKVIHKILDMLKPSYKNLLVLKYFLNMSYKEIADIMDMNEQKVKVYLYRARKKFRKIWEGLN